MPTTKEMIQLVDHNNRPIMFYPNRLRLVQKDERSGRTVAFVSGLGECEVVEQPEQIRDLAGLIGLTGLDGHVFFVRPNITGIRGAKYGDGACVHIPGIGIKEVQESPQQVADIQAAAQNAHWG